MTLTLSILSVAIVGCNGGESAPVTEQPPTVAVQASPTPTAAASPSPTPEPTNVPTATVTPVVPSPTPTQAPTTTPAPTSSVPDAVLEAARSFVEVQFPSSGDGSWITNGILISSNGLVLVGYGDIEISERDFGPPPFYQGSITEPGAAEPIYVRMNKVTVFEEAGLAVYQIKAVVRWPVVEVVHRNPVEPEDEVFSLGVHIQDKWRGSSYSSETAAPLILPGSVVGLSTTDGKLEIEHSTDLAEMSGMGPLIDSEGRLVGFNLRSTRKLGADGFESRTIAIAIEEVRELIDELR